jgi:hypothetical protein
MLKLFISLNEGFVTIPKLNLAIAQTPKIHVTLFLVTGHFITGITNEV